jgi:hypothetical protein
MYDKWEVHEKGNTFTSTRNHASFFCTTHVCAAITKGGDQRDSSTMSFKYITNSRVDVPLPDNPCNDRCKIRVVIHVSSFLLTEFIIGKVMKSGTFG